MDNLFAKSFAHQRCITYIGTDILILYRSIWGDQEGNDLTLPITIVDKIRAATRCCPSMVALGFCHCCYIVRKNLSLIRMGKPIGYLQIVKQEFRNLTPCLLGNFCMPHLESFEAFIRFFRRLKANSQDLLYRIYKNH